MDDTPDRKPSVPETYPTTGSHRRSAYLAIAVIIAGIALAAATFENGVVEAVPTTTVSGPQTAVAQLDPDKPPAVIQPQAFSAPTPVTLGCPGSDVQPELGELSIRRAFAAVLVGDHVALVDRVEGRALWCTPLGLGGRASGGEVAGPTNEPRLDAATLASSSTDGPPIIAVDRHRVWVLQPIRVHDPGDHSTTGSGRRAVIGIDDAGTVTWLRSLDRPEDPPGTKVTFLRDGSTGGVLLIQAHDGWDYSIASNVDLSTGELRETWKLPADADTSVRLAMDGIVVTSSFRMIDESPGWVVYGVTTTDGSGGFTSLQYPHEPSVTAIPGFLITSALGEQAEDRIALWTLPDSRWFEMSTGLLNVDIEDDCTWDGGTVFVCSGTDLDGAPAIHKIDVAKLAVVSGWAEETPKVSDPYGTIEVIDGVIALTTPR